MNYVKATPSKLIAAIASATITAIVTASIVFGMAGLPSQGMAPQVAASSAHGSAHG